MSIPCMGVNTHDIFVVAAPFCLAWASFKFNYAIFSNCDLSCWWDSTTDAHSNRIKNISARYFYIDDADSLFVTSQQNGVAFIC